MKLLEWDRHCIALRDRGTLRSLAHKILIALVVGTLFSFSAPVRAERAEGNASVQIVESTRVPEFSHSNIKYTGHRVRSISVDQGTRLNQQLLSIEGPQVLRSRGSSKTLKLIVVY